MSPYCKQTVNMMSVIVTVVGTFLAIQSACALEVPTESQMIPNDVSIGSNMNDQNACTTTANTCTLGLWTSMSPSINSDGHADVGAGSEFAVENSEVCLFDNKCNVLGCFNRPPGGLPWTATADKLDGNIYITSIEMSIGNPGIVFSHNGQEINSNGGCDCENDGGGIQPENWCRCEFNCNFSGTNAPANTDTGYSQGSCGVHVTHYQIPEGPDNFYSIEATVKDANRNQIGEISRTTAASPIDISSKLPYQLIVTIALPGSVPDTDAEPVNFAYGGDSWDSGDQTRCSQGGYDNGARNIDCSFAC